FGWILEEIHATWAHLEKKRTRLRLYTKSLEEIHIQTVQTASLFLATASDHIRDGVRILEMPSKSSHLNRNPRSFIEATVSKVLRRHLDLRNVITEGAFLPIQNNQEIKLNEVVPSEKQNDDLKKRLAKNNEAKMVIFNALPRKEYEIIFMCNTTKEIWKTVLITDQDKYKDNAFARFNTIITSLKALDECYSNKNYVRKFLRALHPKWRGKVTKIKESKDLKSLSLDELIRNLKVYKMIIKKDSKIVKAKGERKSLALKVKRESSDEESLTSESKDKEYAMVVRDFKKFFKRRGSDEESLTSESKDKEYAMVVRDFKKFFKRRGRFVKEPQNDKKTFQRSRDDKNDKSDRKCFRCGDPNHLIEEFPKPSKDKNQMAFVGGSWSNSGEKDYEKVDDKTYLMAQASSEVHSESSYFSDKDSLIDDITLDCEYNKMCKMNLKIITKNKHLEAIRNSLENEISELKEKLSKLEKNKKVDLECAICQTVKIDNEKLKHKAYIILNKHTMKIKESLNVTFDETPTLSKTSPLVDDDLDEEEAIKVTQKNLENDIEDETLEVDESVNIKESKNHPLENVIGNLNQRALRSQARNQKDSKPVKPPMSLDTKLKKDEECESVDSTKYRGMI
nr:hypothetical protein [Tanacetum cinerariifolium]